MPQIIPIAASLNKLKCVKHPWYWTWSLQSYLAPGPIVCAQDTHQKLTDVSVFTKFQYSAIAAKSKATAWTISSFTICLMYPKVLLTRTNTAETALRAAAMTSCA
jgi:hypothetical protein